LEEYNTHDLPLSMGQDDPTKKWAELNQTEDTADKSDTMSRSSAMVVATLSYGETHWPDIAAHEESVTTFLPSLFNTAIMVRTQVRTVNQLLEH
jgi:hypothetical protein